NAARRDRARDGACAGFLLDATKVSRRWRFLCETWSSTNWRPLLTYIEQQCIGLLRMDMSKGLVAASATPLVLAILAAGDSYGYAIIKRVGELSGGHLQWTDGMLYPVLHRLERQGYVAAKWAASESGRRRKYYRITKDGRAQLA